MARALMTEQFCHESYTNCQSINARDVVNAAATAVFTPKDGRSVHPPLEPITL
jgi:hypothetical protein